MKNHMKTQKHLPQLCLLFLLLALGACKKDKLPAINPVPFSTNGIYVLCEGPFGQTNKSTITFYDVASNTADPDFFKKQNGIDLGSNANDLKLYGSKIYCTVTGADNTQKDSYLQVISVATGKSIKRIPFFDDNKDFMPRFVAFYQNKAYVSGYDGYITKIDTASLNIDARIAVGGAMEGLAIVNGKLYVTNSERQPYSTANNASVSVVDLNTFTKIKDIPVTFSPTRIAAAPNGDLFSISAGNYADIQPALDKISSVTDTKVQSYNFGLQAITIAGNKSYVVGSYPSFFKTFNPATGTLTDFITDGTAIVTPYSGTINPLDNTVIVSDANNYGATGKVVVFAPDGKKKFDFATGAIPQTAVFKYAYR